ncbi:EAL and HDOD domain-containing protein [Wenzhouxiangella limi]|uniref:HDOD domain-containing protein n=1 Tax=Wenzhouxiangella limi TaxID=2707351 RepID=A0A845UVN1_9GAMM|nr:HDOD domain-containing protein [Wenzhouxiangella limi]NDY95883.1 HDOD domain-containing protein [Wenzhouxiangella limi]
MATQPADGYGIALQPVCNQALEHIGDKLLYRESASAREANVDDALLATARACASVMFDIGLQELVGNRFLLCTIPDEWLLQPESILYPPEQTVLEPNLSAWQRAETPAALARLQEAGYRIAVDAAVLATTAQQLERSPDIIKTDFRQRQTPIRTEPAGIGGSLQMATFIETPEQLDEARRAGFDWLQGFVFSLPVVIPRTTHRRSGNRAVELQLLAELSNEECSLTELEPLLAQHPSLAIVVLRQANSAALGPRGRTIDTLTEAMLRVGSGRMRMLISTFMLTSNEPIRRLQARQLLVRAGMAANLAERVASISSPIAFSVGLFSRLDVFEGQPMEQLVRDLPFSGAVRRALTHREGELGKLIDILDGFEAGRFNALGANTTAMLNEDYLRASAWADRWLRDDDDEEAEGRSTS